MQLHCGDRAAGETDGFARFPAAMKKGPADMAGPSPGGNRRRPHAGLVQTATILWPSGSRA